MEGDALVGNLLTVEPLSDEVETTAGRFLARPFLAADAGDRWRWIRTLGPP
jgi:hypothetical protein